MLETIKNILIEYPILAPSIFILIRMLPLIIPPIPGLVIDVIGVAVFGWFWGFIYAEIAIVTASMICFYIGRIFREPLLKKFIAIEKIHALEDQFTEKEKFWTLVGIRFVSAPVFDTVNYVAGLTKIKPITYFFTSIIVTAPIGFVIYYFGEYVLRGPVIIMTSVIGALIILWFIKKKEKGMGVDSF